MSWPKTNLAKFPPDMMHIFCIFKTGSSFLAKTLTKNFGDILPNFEKMARSIFVRYLSTRHLIKFYAMATKDLKSVQKF